MTKARRLIEGATFEPTDLKLLTAVLDEVWASIAADYAHAEMEDARFRLATIILDLAKDGQLSALQIARTAVRLMREAREVATAPGAGDAGQGAPDVHTRKTPHVSPE